MNQSGLALVVARLTNIDRSLPTVCISKSQRLTNCFGATTRNAVGARGRPKTTEGMNSTIYS